MTQNLKPSGRARLSLAGASLVLAGAVALPVAVQAAEATNAAVPTEATDNQIVVRDAETGQLRAPTASEAKALQAARPAAAAARSAGGPARAQTVQRTHRSGAVGVRLSDEFLTYSVAVRQPDGSLATQCFNSKAEADAAMKSAAASSAPTPNTPAE